MDTNIDTVLARWSTPALKGLLVTHPSAGIIHAVRRVLRGRACAAMAACEPQETVCAS